MNDLQYWMNAEIMVTEQMKTIQREAEQTRMLRRTGLANKSGRTAMALGRALVKLGERLQKKHTHPHQACQSTGG